jgi:hypothetical protein
MDSFQAQLTVGNDPNPIETTVTLADSSLEIVSSGESLGRWKIADLGLERILGGYRMKVEGETAVLKFAEPERFASLLKGGTQAATGAKPKAKVKKEKKEPRTTRTRPPKEPSVPAESEASTAQAENPTESPPNPVATGEASTVGWLDRNLEAAEKRFGKYLPDWVFSKGGVVVAVGILALLVAKPHWFSTLFLIIAAMGLITSAIALLDQVIAVRIFRGGFTPIQGLIASLAVGLVGILLGAL